MLIFFYTGNTYHNLPLETSKIMDFHVCCGRTHTDLLELLQELSITEKYNTERQNETGAEESDDVAVIYHVG